MIRPAIEPQSFGPLVKLIEIFLICLCNCNFYCYFIIFVTLLYIHDVDIYKNSYNKSISIAILVEEKTITGKLDYFF